MPKQTGTTPVKEQSDNQLPAWLSELGDRSRGEAHTFLLHFNVRDFVFIPGAEPAAGKPDKPRRIIEYLAHRWRSNNRYDLILYYSLSTGVVPLLNLIGPIETPGLIRFREDQDKMYEELAKVSQQKPYSLSDRYAVAGNAPKYDRTNVPSYVFPLLERLLTLPFRPAQPSTDSNPDQSPQEPQGMRIALVIDYLEHLAPEGMRAAAHDVTQVVETLQRWALDSRIHDNKHLIVLFASDLAQVSAELYANSSSIVKIGRAHV